MISRTRGEGVCLKRSAKTAVCGDRSARAPKGPRRAGTSCSTRPTQPTPRGPALLRERRRRRRSEMKKTRARSRRSRRARAREDAARVVLEEANHSATVGFIRITSIQNERALEGHTSHVRREGKHSSEERELELEPHSGTLPPISPRIDIAILSPSDGRGGVGRRRRRAGATTWDRAALSART